MLAKILWLYVIINSSVADDYKAVCNDDIRIQYETMEWNTNMSISCFYEVDNAAEFDFVTCRRYEVTTTGTNVDNVFHISGPEVRSLNLRFIDVHFENDTLGPNWYNGQAQIELIDFHHCHIRVIKTRAFDAPVFENLGHLGLFSQPELIYFEHNSFYGMPYVYNVIMCCLVFDDINPSSMWGFESSVDQLLLAGFSQAIPLQDLFRRKPLIELADLDLISNPKVKSLAPDNFTVLPQIVDFSIKDSPIEVIFDGTFDAVAGTLRYITLSGTRIHRINSKLFYAILASDPNPNSINFEYRDRIKNIQIRSNPIICDCNYFWLKYLVLANIGTELGHGQVLCNGNINLEPSAIALRSCNLGVIHIEKMCFATKNVKLLAYANFQIHLERMETEGYLRIHGNMTGIIRVLSIPFEPSLQSSTKCRNPRWLRANTKCYLMKSDASDLRVPIESNPSTFIFTGISFVTARGLWPLHMITIKPTDAMFVEYVGPYPILIFGTATSFVGLFIGIFCTLLFKKRPEEPSYVAARIDPTVAILKMRVTYSAFPELDATECEAGYLRMLNS